MRGWGIVVVGALGCGAVVAPPDSDGSDSTSTGSAGTSVEGSTGPETTSGAVDATSDDGWLPPCDLLSPTTSSGEDTGACLPWASQGCVLEPAAASTVEGTTPLGEGGAFAYALFASNMWCDECITATRINRIVLASTPEVLMGLGSGEAPAEGIVIELDDFEGPLQEFVPATFTAHREGESLGTVEGTVAVDALPEPSALAEPYDPQAPAIVTGLVSVSEPGWALEGAFAAAHCPQMNDLVVCE